MLPKAHVHNCIQQQAGRVMCAGALPSTNPQSALLISIWVGNHVQLANNHSVSNSLFSQGQVWYKEWNMCATRLWAVLGVPARYACPALSPAVQALLLLLLPPVAATAVPPLQHALVLGLQATAQDARARRNKSGNVCQ